MKPRDDGRTATAREREEMEEMVRAEEESHGGPELVKASPQTRGLDEPRDHCGP